MPLWLFARFLLHRDNNFFFLREKNINSTQCIFVALIFQKNRELEWLDRISINLCIWPIRDWLIFIDHLLWMYWKRINVIFIRVGLLYIFITWWDSYAFFYRWNHNSWKMHRSHPILQFIFTEKIFHNKSNHSHTKWPSYVQLNWRSTCSTWSIFWKVCVFFLFCSNKNRDFCVCCKRARPSMWNENGKFNGETANKSKLLWVLLEMNLSDSNKML